MQKIVNGELVDMTAEDLAQYQLDQEAAAKPPVSAYQTAVQSLIDETAVSKQFNDGVSLASYKESTVPEWAAQASSFIAWRDQVWAYCYSEMAKIQTGQRPQPTVAEIIGELPVITWPA